MKKNVLFKNTGSKEGRNWIITPENSELESLGYARIKLGGGISQINYENPDFEAALICMSGEGTVKFDDQSFTIRAYDTIFLPPGNKGTISTDSTLDIVESTAPSDWAGEPVFIPFKELNEDPELT